jgi:hypothetical protein
MGIKKYTKEQMEQMEDKTDYERLKKMTEEEIRKNAESDPDVPLQSESDLANFKPVKKRIKDAKDNES